MARQWRRNIFRGLLGVTLVFGVAVATLPWWWPAILGRMDGVTFERAVTSGWSTVELREVRYEREGLEVSATSLRVPAFGIWPKAGESAAVLAEGIVVTLLPAPRADAPAPSAHRLVSDILNAWAVLERWLPSVRIENLEIGPVEGDAAPVHLAELRWDGARLEASGRIPNREETATVSVEHPGPHTLAFTGSVPAMELNLAATAELSDDQLYVDAGISWRETQIQASAAFGADGVIPTSATMDAPAMVLSAGQIGLPAYGPITGSVHATWNGESYAVNVVAQSDAADPDANVPPLRIDVRAAGDPAQVRVESAQVQIPGVEAHLSSPLELDLPGGTPSAPAEFSLDIDLADLPYAPASGQITGQVNVTGGPGIAPAAEFYLSGSGIEWRDGTIPTVAIAGDWRPDRLNITRGDVELGAASELRATGEFDLRSQRIIEATVTAEVASEALDPWLPDIPEFRRLTASAQARGHWLAPEHSGEIAWEEFAGPAGAVDGEISWRGRGLESAELDGALRGAGAINLPFAGIVTRDEEGTLSAELTKLAWHDAQGEWWQLEDAAMLNIGPGGIELDDLRLAGEEMVLGVSATVAWPAVGQITITAHNIATARLAPLLPGASVPATVEDMMLNATWDRGPVQLDGFVRATYAVDEATPYSLGAEFRSESENLVFGAVRIFSSSGAVLQGEGRLPLLVAGDQEGFQLRLPDDGELSLQLDSTPNPDFWEAIARTTGWTLHDPDVHVNVEGTLTAPEGRIEVSARTLQPPASLAEAVQLPRLGDVAVIAVADGNGLRLDEAIWTIDGSWVSLDGEVPWSVVREARAGGAVPWRQAKFSFAADRLPMTIASRAVPRVLAPDGTMSFQVDHEPGQGFEGFLWLEGLGVRPIQPLGAIRDIGGSLLLDGYQLTLRNVAAFLGGRPVEIGGRANLADLEQPTFDFHVVSSRVPLVRQEGLVVRAELRLRVQQTAGEATRVSGSAELGRSVFVSDLVGLLPTGGGLERPEQRPPFFSVPAEPFAAWQLDVNLHGSEFMSVQSPFFRTELSADFTLGGTLEEPRAQGRAWTDQGTIIFPFGSLEVQDAEVSLTPENPFTLALRAAASTRLYGYDIRLNVSGTAQEPRLQFSSDPPLSSQQVFLMLSAGELPDTDHSFSSSERAQRLAWFIGRNLASTFGIGGGAGGGDRLEVRSGEDFSREGEETIYAQYDLDDRWSVVAEKDRFDAFNVGIKFRLVDK